MYGGLLEGYLARRIKPSWIIGTGNFFQISTEAFDLREGQPPETYVSFYQVNSLQDFLQAKEIINFKLPNFNGAISIFDIKDALEEVNDSEEDIIKFSKIDNNGHCGLFFITTNQSLIQEAKTTLSLLAKKHIMAVKQATLEKHKIPLIE